MRVAQRVACACHISKSGRVEVEELKRVTAECSSPPLPCANRVTLLAMKSAAEVTRVKSPGHLEVVEG